MASISDVPYNLEAETAVLGSLLIDPHHAHIHIDGWLTTDHFYDQKNRWVYAAMQAINKRGEAVDFLTLTTELTKMGQLDAMGGSIYISKLLTCVPSAMNIESYARIVVDAWRRRQMLDVVADVARLAYQPDQDITSASDYIKTRMAELFTENMTNRRPQAFSELSPTLPKIEWLWPEWVPQGMLTLMGAVAGAGKSMVALDLVKRVIHGMPFPNGANNPHPEGQTAIYVDAEVVPQILKERAENWNIDTSKLFVMLPRPNEMIDFSNQFYQDLLRNMAGMLHPGIIIIDSLSSISSKGENAIEDVRAILGFLNDIATTFHTSVMIIHHLRKRNGSQMVLPGIDLGIDDFRGSTHIIAMARSVIGLSVVQIGPDNDPNGPRKLAVLKSNLCRIPDPIGCEFLPLHPKGVMIQWETKAPEPFRQPTKLEQCAHFIETILRNSEPISPKEMVAIARDEGYSKDLVFQARKHLGAHVQNTGGYKDPSNQWKWVG